MNRRRRLALPQERLEAVARTVVEAVQAALPPDLRTPALSVPVVLERTPGAELLADGWEPDLLGLFMGMAYPDEESGGAELPPQIMLFLQNLWDYAGEDITAFRDEVRTTYLHELGHYLGLDEGEIEARGLA